MISNQIKKISRDVFIWYIRKIDIIFLKKSSRRRIFRLYGRKKILFKSLAVYLS